MGIAIAHQTTLETEECCKCGVIFAMPASTLQNLKERGGDFWCPNGHPQHYIENEVQRLRKKLDEQTRTASLMADRAMKAEKKTERLLKRAKAGVCTCCNRTFQNLARHMKSKHADK